MASATDILECPFCPYKSLDSYVLQLHVEERHTDDSPFVVREGPDAVHGHRHHGSSSANALKEAPADNDCRWVLCPDPECGEQIPIEDLNEHLDLHDAETLFEQEASAPALHNTASSHSSSSVKPPKKLVKMRHGTPVSSIASEHSFSPTHDESSDSSAFALDGEPPRYHHQYSKHDSHHHHQQGYDHGNVKTRPRSDSEKTSLPRSIADVLSLSSSKKPDKGKKPGARSARLGKSELGPYAFEEQMPRWLYKQIEAGPKTSVVNHIGRDGRLIKHTLIDNETPGILPILAQLCSLDRSVDQAYLCHPSTVHIFKRPREGGFCGYRNLQMLISYIQGAKAQGHTQFPPGTPGILVLQDLIEQAWDMGINEVSRIQTGGIKGTRKYIGTPEVQALLRSLRIDHGLRIFSDSAEIGQAHEQLLNYAESYFKEGITQEQQEKRPKIIKTHLPPIYLQQPGHSITIVGYERHKDGKRNLLVFDPMFHTSPGMSKILGRCDLRGHRPEVLQAYRRGNRQLKRHSDYELISLKAHPPLFPVWDVLEQYGDHPYVYGFFHVPSLSYDVIPEDEFPIVFPWWRYGCLFCIGHARFAHQPRAIDYSDDFDRFDIERVQQETDTGLLGGMPPLQDACYLDWIEFFDRIKKASVGFNVEARNRLNQALRSARPENEGDLLFQEPLPEDVYFEKSVGSSVAVHYPCGGALRPGYRHYSFKRCGPAWSHSVSESSSAPSTNTPALSLSPDFQQSFGHFIPSTLQQRGGRSRTAVTSDTFHDDTTSSAGLLHPQYYMQQRAVDNISPRTSLSGTTLLTDILETDHPTAFHKRLDSGAEVLGHTVSYTNPFAAQSAPLQTVSTMPETQLSIPSPRRPSTPPRYSSNHRFNTHLRSVSHLLKQRYSRRHQQSSTDETATPPFRPAPEFAASPPPVVDFGSVDLLSFSSDPSTAEVIFSPSSSASSPCFPFGGSGNTRNSADDGNANKSSKRAPTPVQELRDFFFERSAEGVSTPVFYSTGGSDVSKGWRAKMGAEW